MAAEPVSGPGVLHIGDVPEGNGRYYIIWCDCGETQLHEPTNITPSDVKPKLVKEHREKLGCRCQLPA